MGSSRDYWEDRLSEEEREYSKEVLNFLDAFRLLSIDGRICFAMNVFSLCSGIR